MNGDQLLEIYRDIMRVQHPTALPEHHGAGVLELIRRPAVEETCERCGGWLMREVSNPESARCMACGEPVRRIT